MQRPLYTSSSFPTGRYSLRRVIVCCIIPVLFACNPVSSNEQGSEQTSNEVVSLEQDTVSSSNQDTTGTASPVLAVEQIPVPDNFQRIQVSETSFADFLRQLPLKPLNSPVILYNGQRKGNQSAHYAVVDLPIGTRDLHQCADAVMRLKAEYHFRQKDYGNIHFKYTSGDEVRYEDWVRGKRPKVSGNRVVFSTANQNPDYSYPTFWKYLENIFTYAGTASLTKELQKVGIKDIQIGDVFIKGGFPGHAVIVVDMVKNEGGEKRFLLAQSYMPAQELHVLKNPASDEPWYSIPELHEELVTPEWTFAPTDLKRFP